MTRDIEMSIRLVRRVESLIMVVTIEAGGVEGVVGVDMANRVEVGEAAMVVVVVVVMGMEAITITIMEAVDEDEGTVVAGEVGITIRPRRPRPGCITTVKPQRMKKEGRKKTRQEEVEVAQSRIIKRLYEGIAYHGIDNPAYYHQLFIYHV